MGRSGEGCLCEARCFYKSNKSLWSQEWTSCLALSWVCCGVGEAGVSVAAI